MRSLSISGFATDDNLAMLDRPSSKVKLGWIDRHQHEHRASTRSREEHAEGRGHLTRVQGKTHLSPVPIA